VVVLLKFAAVAPPSLFIALRSLRKARRLCADSREELRSHLLRRPG